MRIGRGKRQMPRTPEREAFLKDQALGFTTDMFDQFHTIFHAVQSQNPELSNDDVALKASQMFYPILIKKFQVASNEDRFKMTFNLAGLVFVALGKMHKENDSE